MPVLATVATFGFPDFYPPTYLPVYYRLGCRSAQYYRNPQNPARPGDARKIMRDSGLPCDSIHGVFGREYDISTGYERYRLSMMQVYENEGILATELGGPMVVVHPAPICLDGVITEQDREVRVDPLRRSLADLARMGERIRVVYLIENLPPNYYIGADPVQLAELLREVNSPWLKMCFDVGHSHMNGDVVEHLDACRDVIGYLHIHDNNRAADSHLMPFDGNLPWQRQAVALAKLGKKIPGMLECFELEDKLKARVLDGYGEKLAKVIPQGC
jgi:sugar phosphate isomerase/epimerase